MSETGWGEIIVLEKLYLSNPHTKNKDLTNLHFGKNLKFSFCIFAQWVCDQDVQSMSVFKPNWNEQLIVQLLFCRPQLQRFMESRNNRSLFLQSAAHQLNQEVMQPVQHQVHSSKSEVVQVQI